MGHPKISVRCLLLAVCIACAVGVRAQSPDEMAIREVLAGQIQAWNSGDLNAFMRHYWKSDSLEFIGKNGVTRGYDSTLARYRRTYPDRKAMGTLQFRIAEVRQLSADCYFVVGQWTLVREHDQPGGYYTLLFRKIQGQWKIVVDHTS